jgi:hypothetical protein
MAEIGRIISFTPDLNGAYERFAEEVRKLISFGPANLETQNLAFSLQLSADS